MRAAGHAGPALNRDEDLPRAERTGRGATAIFVNSVLPVGPMLSAYHVSRLLRALSTD